MPPYRENDKAFFIYPITGLSNVFNSYNTCIASITYDHSNEETCGSKDD